MLEINRNPSPRDLRWFGLVTWPLFLVVGALSYFRAGNHAFAWVLWVGSSLLTALYYRVPALQRPAYVGWMTLVFPLGWVLSHAILALVYYLCVTPIGLVLRALGRSPVRTPGDPQATTYWTPRVPPGTESRYFRQF